MANIQFILNKFLKFKDEYEQYIAQQINDVNQSLQADKNRPHTTTSTNSKEEDDLHQIKVNNKSEMDEKLIDQAKNLVKMINDINIQK